MCIYDIQKILLDMTKQQLDDITGVTDNCGKTLHSTGSKPHVIYCLMSMSRVYTNFRRSLNIENRR